MSQVLGSELKFEWVRTPEQVAKLQGFAKSFDHDIGNPKLPLCIVKRNEIWKGYGQIINEPIVFTAWHTDRSVCSPRDLIEGMKAFTYWGKLQHGSVMTAVPMDSKTFTPEVMKKLGAKRLQQEIYVWES